MWELPGWKSSVEQGKSETAEKGVMLGAYRFCSSRSCTLFCSSRFWAVYFKTLRKKQGCGDMACILSSKGLPLPTTVPTAPESRSRYTCSLNLPHTPSSSCGSPEQTSYFGSSSALVSGLVPPSEWIQGKGSQIQELESSIIFPKQESLLQLPLPIGTSVLAPKDQLLTPSQARPFFTILLIKNLPILSQHLPSIHYTYLIPNLWGHTEKINDP